MRRWLKFLVFFVNCAYSHANGPEFYVDICPTNAYFVVISLMTLMLIISIGMNIFQAMKYQEVRKLNKNKMIISRNLGRSFEEIYGAKNPMLDRRRAASEKRTTAHLINRDLI